VIQIAIVGASTAGTGPLTEIEAAARPPGSFPLTVARAKLIVLGALLRIAQDFVRLVDLFKMLFRLLVTRIFIRVIALRQFSKSAFNFFLSRRFADAQNLVIILVFHYRTPLTLEPV